MITQEQHDSIVAELNQRLIERTQGMGNKIAELRNALSILFQAYKGLADSGDAGHWRLEDTDAGKVAMAALGIKEEPQC